MVNMRELQRLSQDNDIVFHLIIIYLLVSLALQSSADYGILVHEVSWSHTTTGQSR
jgi:hypothetical protein